MSIASEITRLQIAKANLKTSLNAKNDLQHQITDETIDEYYLFADSITGGGGDTILDVGSDNVIVSGTTLIFNKEALPYIELEYIQSSGTQFIDIGIVPNLNTKIITEFSAVGSQPSDNFMGSRQTNSGNDGAFGIISFGSSGKIGFFKFGQSIQGISYDTNYHTYTLSNTEAQIDTNIYSISSSLSTGNLNKNFLLFGFNNGDTITRVSEKIKSFKMYDGNTLIRDLIPVRRKSDYEICMFDKINNIFYKNAGTGDFIAGNEI